MKDVYYDLYLLEQYVLNKKANEGIALVMNELERLVKPKNKDAKCWIYDISHKTTIQPALFNTPIGGKKVHFRLENQYKILWKKWGSFWFLKTEPYR